MNMIRVIKSELFRFCKSKTIIVMLIISILYLFIQSIPLQNIIYKMAGLDAPFELQIGYNAFSNTGFMSLFTFFVPFLVVFYFTSEYSNKTLRNYFLINISRSDIFLGKCIILFITMLAITTISSILTTINFTLLNGWGIDFKLYDALNIMIFLPIRISLAYFTDCLIIIFLSLFIHNSSIIVILYFVISLVESIIYSFLIIINNFFINKILLLLPSNIINYFTPLNITYDSLGIGLLLIFVLIVFSISISCFIFNKKDIYC